MTKQQVARPRWLGLIVGYMAAVGIDGCSYAASIQEFPDPWQVLNPGKPTEKPPRVEIVTQGKGTTIELGDLVQVTQKTWLIKDNEFIDENDWWLWIGFRGKEETTFSSVEPRLNNALVGLRQGTSLKFLDARNNWVSAGKLQPNPLGDPNHYSWRKNTVDFTEVYIPYESGYSLIEIKRVCKGQAQYRTVRLFDDSSVQRCTWAPINCKMTDTPREGWVDEAKIEALCTDGRKAVFQYGPVTSRNGKEWRGPINPYNHFEPWMNDRWEELPKGVQIEGNHPPVVRSLRFTVRADTPTRLNLLEAARDSDGDRLVIRTRRVEYGSLSPNADGSYTYTPKPGWTGIDTFEYRASDGMAESAPAEVKIDVER